MRPINVLHVTANLAGGGVERLLVKSLAMLDKSNFTHQVCCVSGGGIYETDLETLGIPCHIMKRRARFDPFVLLQMAQLMRRHRIDVVHTLNFTANAWGRVAAKLAGVPYIIAHERGTGWTENRLMRLVDRSLYWITDLWLANSEAAKIILTQQVGIPADRIRVIYNGLPQPLPVGVTTTSLRARLGIGRDVPLVGTVGRLDTPKGHSFLLQAIPLVWQSLPQTHFVFIGDGPLRNHLNSTAESMGLLGREQVHFLGYLPNASQLISELDVLAHPSIRESLGNVLIEAGFARRPVVATCVDGCAEVIVDGKTGILLDGTQLVEPVAAPGASPLPPVVVDGRTRKLRPPLGPDPLELAAALVALLHDPQQRQVIGLAAESRVREMFTLERFTRLLEAAYRREM